MSDVAVSTALEHCPWPVVELGECLLSSPSYGINAAAVPYRHDLPTYIRITDIDDDGRFAPTPKVSVDDPAASEYYLEPGDIVLARTGASVGKSYLHCQEDGRLVFAGFLIRVRVDERKLHPEFLAQYLRSRPYWDWVEGMSLRSGQPGLNSREYASLPIPLPDLTEQRHVASVLRDADELISALDREIQKYESVKKALSHELISRPHEESASWNNRSISDVALLYGGLSGKSADDFGTGRARYVTFLDVIEGPWVDGSRFERVRVDERESQSRVRRGDVLCNATTETPEELALASVVCIDADNVYLNSFCLGLRPDSDQVIPEFLAYLLRSAAGRKKVLALAQGATRYNLSKRQFARLVFRFPDIAEQQRIVDVLCDLDHLMQALRARRQKTREVKLGMMQALLTGRTRLPVDEAAA